jgi:flagellar basal body-associated protein FliL
MAAKVKTWVWVVVAIVVIGILGVVAVAGIGFYFFSQHVSTKVTSPASAAREFAEVGSRFTGQTPLIELDDRGHLVHANTDRAPGPKSAPLEALHVLVFNPRDSRIVRISIPFWFLRMKMHGTTIDFNGNRMDLEDLKLSVEDLERYGPTLIVDHKGPDGEHVLVWSQ